VEAVHQDPFRELTPLAVEAEERMDMAEAVEAVVLMAPITLLAQEVQEEQLVQMEAVEVEAEAAT
jgi:hypothetical protein